MQALACATDMSAHRALCTVRVASLQSLKNRLVLFKRSLCAAWLGAGLETIETQLIVQTFHQQMLEPLVAGAANDLEMEVLILRALIVALGTEHGGIRAVARQKALQRQQLFVGNPLSGRAARHPFQRLPDGKQLEQILLRQLNDADAHPRRTRHQAILETPQSLSQRPPADAQLPGNLSFRNPLARLELTGDDRLDDLAERLSGDRRGMGNGFENGMS